MTNNSVRQYDNKKCNWEGAPNQNIKKKYYSLILYKTFSIIILEINAQQPENNPVT